MERINALILDLPSISFHAFRKSSGSEKATKPYFAYVIVRIEKRYLAQSSYLIAQAVSNNTSLLEGGVLIEGVGENVIRNIVAEITNEEAEPRYLDIRQCTSSMNQLCSQGFHSSKVWSSQTFPAPFRSTVVRLPPLASFPPAPPRLSIAAPGT